MKKVVIESPFAGDTQRNTKYLKAAIHDALGRGESPYASHGFFTHFLDDDRPDERRLGINAGLAWAVASDFVVCYLDLGISSGMYYALEKHTQAARDIQVRLLSGEPFIEFMYKDYPVGQSKYKARFQRFLWGRTEHDAKDQVLMEAYCLVNCEERIFAVSDMTIIPSQYGEMMINDSKVLGLSSALSKT